MDYERIITTDFSYPYTNLRKGVQAAIEFNVFNWMEKMFKAVLHWTVKINNFLSVTLIQKLVRRLI